MPELYFKKNGGSMKIAICHKWDITLADAQEIQKQLSLKINPDEPAPTENFRNIAAADVSFNRFSNRLFGALVIYDLNSQCVLEKHVGEQIVTFPYVPGYLSFREIPVLLPLFEKLRCEPDVVLCDGQGIAHPRGLGLASHLGLLLDRPSIGCAKSVLVGEYVEPDKEKGSYTPLIYQGRVVGAAVRTRSGVKPVYVSPGHRITLEQAIKCILRLSPRYRIPQPLRIAHQLVNEVRRERTM